MSVHCHCPRPRTGAFFSRAAFLLTLLAGPLGMGACTGSADGGGGTPGVGGTGDDSGNVGTGGGVGPTTGTGGATTGTGGRAGGATGTGGSRTGTGGAPVVTGAGGSTVTPPGTLDCGPIGTALYNAGPPANRVNYVILADGYTSTTVNTTLMTHMTAAMNGRFTPIIGEPYIRYKNFVNICLFKTVSQNDGISQTGAANGSTIFNCFGDDQSRLGNCDTAAAQRALTANTPAGMTVDWHSIVMNNTRWWNTGSVWMLWSGGNADGPKGAMHEGGHGFHQLADEYGTCTGANCGSNTMGTGTAGTENREVNSTGNPMTTGGKWDLWMNTTQTGATGLQGTWLGSRYVGAGQYRPSANSMMNSLFGNNVNTSFNSVSREQIIMTIWRYVVPIDSTVPAAGAVSNPATLTVNVIDPAVISVDWTVDGTVMANAGTTFDASKLAPGTHTISAKAYDNAGPDLVKYRSGTCPTSVTGTYCSRTAWSRSQQTVTWTVTKS
jgi:hypothetical protein